MAPRVDAVVDASQTAAAVTQDREPGGAPLWLRGGLMFVQIFGVVAAFTLTKAVRDAVFLSHFRMHALAYVSLVLAVLSGLFVALHHRVVSGRMPAGPAGTVTLIGVAASMAAFGLAMTANVPWVPWGLYLWSGVFGLFLVAQFWSNAHEVCDPREAKRLFPVLAAGASLGGTAGGYLAHTLSDNLGESGLVWLIAGVLLLCAGLNHAVWHVRPRDAAIAYPGDPAAPATTALEGLRAIRESPVLRTAALVLLCSVVAGTLFDWQVKAIVKAQFHSDRAAMTDYFGRLLALPSLVALALQLVTGPLLRRAGVATGLLVLPAAMIGGALLIVGQPAVGISLLAAATVAKTVEGGARFSVDKAALELLYLPVQGRVRQAGKGLIDTVADRIGGALAAGIWLALQAGFDVEEPSRTHVASVVIVGVALAWGAVALRAREHYLDAFRAAISRLEFHPGQVRGRIADAGQRRALEAALASEHEAEVMLALDILSDPENHGVRVSFGAPLQHAREGVRVRALEVLAARKDPSDAARAAELLGDRAPAVRAAAARWVLAVGAERVSRAVRSALPPAAAQVLHVAAMPDDRRARALEALATSVDSAERVVAAVLAPPAGRPDVSLGLSRDDNAEVGFAAAAALSTARDARATDAALALLRHAGFRKRAVELLSRPWSVRTVIARYVDATATPVQRSALADALARSRAVEALEPLMAGARENDAAVRDPALRALDRLRREASLGPPESWVDAEIDREITRLGRLAACVTALPVLTDTAPNASQLCRLAATEEIDRGIARLFTLAGLVGSPKEMRDVYLTLRDGSPRVRATSVEFLDNVLPASLRQRLVRAVEPSDPQARCEALIRITDARIPAEPAEALRTLCDDAEPWLRAVAAGALLRQGEPIASVPTRDGEHDPRVQSILTADRPRPWTDDARPDRPSLDAGTR